MVLTMGDPAGIGPEIIVKAFLERPELLRQLVVAGDVGTLHRAVQRLSAGSKPLMLAEVEGVGDLADVPPGCMAVVQACQLSRPVEVGRINELAGRAAADCIAWAAQANTSARLPHSVGGDWASFRNASWTRAVGCRVCPARSRRN